MVALVANRDDKPPKDTNTKEVIPIKVDFENLEEGAVLSGTTDITVSLKDISRVVRVEYYLDAAFFAVTYAAPYQLSLDTTKLSDGKHTIQARAYDKDNNAFSSKELGITVDNTTATPEEPKKATTASIIGTNVTPAPDTSDDDTPVVVIPDTTDPTTPTSLLLSASDGYTAVLGWSSSTDNVGVTGYRVYRDGNLIGSSTTTSYLDQTVVPGNTYDYTVRAIDAAANESTDSNEPTITLVPTNIWLSADVPSSFDTDPTPLELGVKFRPLVSGTITGIRFYKGSGNTGTHIGKLWAGTGGPALATATFSGESSTGWQQVSFLTPVSVTANTTYVASYNAPNGHLAYTSNYFATAGITSQYLTAMASGVDGNNGVYNDTPGNFPTNSFNNTNYWVDVVFVPNPAAGGPTAKTTADTTNVYAGHPGSNNTGVPVGKRLPTRDRDILAYGANTTIENIDLTGEILIRAANITVKNSKITGLVYVDTDDPGSTNWHVTVQDTEIDTGMATRGSITLGQFDALRVNLHGGQAGILCSGDCSITDSFVHDHYLPDGVSWGLSSFTSNGGDNLSFINNTILCDTPPNGDGGHCSTGLSLTGDFAAITNVLVDGNYFPANPDSEYCASFGHHLLTPFGPDAANIVVQNNVFERGPTGFCGSVSPTANYLAGGNPPLGTSSWTNNRYSDGTIIPAQ
jgi:hypothetical protein